MIFYKEPLWDASLFGQISITILYININNGIGVEGCKGLGGGIRTLVNLTSLYLDLG